MSEPSPPAIRAHETLPEGEEHPPPGTPAMSMIRWALVGAMALAAASTWVYHGTASGMLSHERARFHCPMHPSIVASRGGECPICGMDLVPVAGEASASAPAASEHPAVPSAPERGAGAGYTCPMHPAFVTSDPRARCPDCGMKLVPREPARAAAAELPGLGEVELTVDRIQLIGLKTAPAVWEPLGQSIRTVGFVTSNEAGLASVNARFSGWVESLAVAETGRFVEKGAILAAVYAPETVTAQQIFLNAMRFSELRQSGGAVGIPPPGAPVAPGSSPQAADLERDARQRLELLGIADEDIDALARTGQIPRAVNVRAPVRGYIARKNVLRGVYVQAGTELFQIADLSTIWVLADVYEREIGRVKVGQEATLELTAWPGERFEGKVEFLYPALNTGSRTLQARLAFRNPRLKLRPGMYGDVTLHVGAAEAVVIPRDALVDTGELQYVFVAKDRGRFSPRRVRAGWSGDDKVAILEGLAERELVVTSANFLLDSESRLRAALDGPAATARAEAGPSEHAGHAGQDDGHTGDHDGRAELAESDAL